MKWSSTVDAVSWTHHRRSHNILSNTILKCDEPQQAKPDISIRKPDQIQSKLSNRITSHQSQFRPQLFAFLHVCLSSCQQDLRSQWITTVAECLTAVTDAEGGGGRLWRWRAISDLQLMNSRDRDLWPLSYSSLLSFGSLKLNVTEWSLLFYSSVHCEY